MGAKQAAGFRQAERLTEEAAEALTAEIADLLTASYRQVVPLIIRAFRGRAWAAVGYTSWDDYCRANFHGPRMLRFTDEQLTEMCADFAEAGFGVRAIGSALGIGSATAARKVNKSGRQIPATVTGIDERRESPSSELRAAKPAHPAGKKIDTANMRPAEIILMHISLSAGEGLTYLELCTITGWRDAPVTGAISTLTRSGKITAGERRDGATAWRQA